MINLFRKKEASQESSARTSNNNKLFIAVGLLFCVSLGTTTYFYVQSAKEVKNSTVISDEPGVDLENFNPKVASDSNPHEEVDVKSLAKSDTYYQSIWKATSTNGISWVQENQPAIEHGASPDILLKSDGTEIIYYNDGLYGTLGCKEVKDGKMTDQECRVYNAKGEKILDPEVVDTGKYFRMYFTSPAENNNSTKANQKNNGFSVIKSAVSKDGINWLEEGIALQGDNQFSEPAVIKVGSSWTMVVVGAGEKLQLANSLDGKKFSLANEISGITSSSPHFLQMGSIFNLYYCKNGIVNTSTVDGENWVGSAIDIPAQSGEIICDPTVQKLANGSLEMYYKKQTIAQND